MEFDQNLSKDSAVIHDVSASGAYSWLHSEWGKLCEHGSTSEWSRSCGCLKHRRCYVVLPFQLVCVRDLEQARFVSFCSYALYQVTV